MQFKTMTRLGILPLTLAAVGALTYGLLAASSVGAERAPSTSAAATNDDDWIALIDQAKRAQNDGSGGAPTVVIPDGVTRLDSCSWLPAEIHFSQVSNEPGSTPGTGQTVLEFTDVSESGDGPRYLMTVNWNSSLDGCDPHIKTIVNGAKHDEQAIDAHICDQMKLAAGGNHMTDPTMAQPSSRVAQAYLSAFCSPTSAP